MRIVIKIGTSSVSNKKANSINFLMIETLARAVSDIIDNGNEVILVTSGAVGYGVVKLGEVNTRYSNDDYIPALEEKPFLSSVGQPQLMKCYIDCFAHYNKQVAQILISGTDDFTDKYAAKTISYALENNVIPIINENDSVYDAELKIGDNDTLSAHVAKFLKADHLFLITDIDGFHISENGQLGPLVSYIRADDIDNFMQHAGGSGATVGIGGMRTKLEAAKIACASGTVTHIINNTEIGNIQKIIDGAGIGTRIG